MANFKEAFVELLAPSSWKKLYYPYRAGTPMEPQIVFVAPNEEKICTKRQLKKYLKENPNNPAASNFDWTTGDTPRRSPRIVAKLKGTPSTSKEPAPKKRRSHVVDIENITEPENPKEEGAMETPEGEKENQEADQGEKDEKELVEVAVTEKTKTEGGSVEPPKANASKVYSRRASKVVE